MTDFRMNPVRGKPPGHRSLRAAWPGALIGFRLGLGLAFGLGVGLGVGGIPQAQADIGRPVASGPVGEFRLNVIAFPAQLGVGDSTWTVLVRDRVTGDIRTDVTVDVEGRPVPKVSGPAPDSSRARPGMHPGFYSARIHLAESGPWQGQIRVHSPEGETASLGFGFEVGPKENPWRAHMAAVLFPLVALMLFVWHQVRVKGRGARRPSHPRSSTGGPPGPLGGSQARAPKDT